MSPVYPPREPARPVGLLLFGCLCRRELLDEALGAVAERYGALAVRSEVVPFTWTDYYESEMGQGLVRCYVALETLIFEDELVAVKHDAAELEHRWTDGEQRRVNLDPGYVDYHKVVLASWKDGRHKIYVGRGVWADPVLMYAGGRFHTQEWTFPDLRDGLFSDFFLKARARFKGFVRQGRPVRTFSGRQDSP